MPKLSLFKFEVALAYTKTQKPMQNTIKSNDQRKINWLRLARSQNIGRVTFFSLLKIFGSVEKVLEQIEDYLKSIGSKKEIKIAPISVAERELENNHKFASQIILFDDEAYPKLLREIHDPSPILTVKGRIEFLEKDIFAVVGPRNASFHSANFAKKMAQELSETELVVASGMARGIDCAAHQGAIKSGTIAVIAGGIDHIYPRDNTDLYHKISKDGLVISEQPFGFTPYG